MDPKYHILLLGGTGTCGLIFVRAALEEGHKLTLYLRSPSKISVDLFTNPNLTVIEGQLEDAEGLKKAAACGANIFISLAGPTMGRHDGTPVTNALHTLYPLLLANGTTKRILVLSTASYSAPEDTTSIKWFVAINFYVKVIGGDTYDEVTGIAKETVALGENINWTVFRVPLLQGKELDGNPGDVNASYVGDKRGRDGLHLDRGRLARWLLGELDEGKWIGACPLLANA